MAASLVEVAREVWRPDQYHDNYREQLLALIDLKGPRRGGGYRRG